MAHPLRTIAFAVAVAFVSTAGAIFAQGGPSPEESAKAIAGLPAALQPTFVQTLAAEKKIGEAHRSGDPAGIKDAEMAMARSILATTEKTKAYLQTASPEDTAKIGQVLAFFSGPAGAPAGDPMALCARMMAEARQRIQQIESDAPMGGQPGMGHDPSPHPQMGPPGMPHNPDKHPQTGQPGMGRPSHGAMDAPTGMNVPPECSDALRNSELQPQGTVDLGGTQGNLLFRTVCAGAPYDTNAISLPAGRTASGFDVEAATPGKITFGVRVEGGANVWTTADGKDAFHALNLGEGAYRIFLDAARSDPGARVTVRFVDHP